MDGADALVRAGRCDVVDGCGKLLFEEGLLVRCGGEVERGDHQECGREGVGVFFDPTRWEDALDGGFG